MPPGTTSPITSPTGESWQIGHGRQTAVITEVGATLRSFSFGGEPVVDGFTEGEWSQGGRGQVLAPWPNRLGDGRYTFRGQTSQLPLDEPERGNAIHGLVRWMPWRLEAKAQNMLVVSCMLYPRPGYPFTLSLRIQYHLGRDGLQVTTTAWNAGSEELPFGLGFHPYLTVGTSRVDSASLRVPAASRLVADDRGLATGEVRSVLGTEYDFTTVRPLGPVCLDTCYTDLRRDDDGRATVELRDSGGERSVDLWVSEQFAHLMCFTGDTLEEGRRRRAIAVEPMTCPPDAFRSRRDLVTLEPGGSWIGSWGIRPH